MEKKYLYVTLPLIGVITVHLLLSYANWDLNPGNWDEQLRTNTVLLMVFAIIAGIFSAALSNDKN
tara:strand:+ start:284 stop:478 length:195 start_codon:yes stop_codon:yes gene_type:complete